VELTANGELNLQTAVKGNLIVRALNSSTNNKTSGITSKAKRYNKALNITFL